MVMKRFSFLTAMLCVIFLRGVDTIAGERPNVVFILADDLGYGDLGCYGRSDIRTPELDRLARQGVRLTQHYANGAECTPTRAAFLTGRYQQWVGGLECAIGTGNVGRYDDAIRLRSKDDLGLPTNLPTIAKLLKSAGYATAICGKWHLGYEPKFAPHLHGFDTTYYCIGGEMDYFHYLDKAAGYNLFVDGNPIAGKGYFTDLMTDKAIEFVNEQSPEKPFFLYLPYTCPHAPFQGPSDEQPQPLHLDSPLWSQGKAPADVYIAMIEHMDRRIGDVLRALDRQGLAENTVVIFASDNGGTASARNAPLRGTKGSTFEGGIRVPGIIRWPGKIPSGIESAQTCITFDFTRSIAALAGVKDKPIHAFEGIDIVQHVAQRKPDLSRTLFRRKQRGDRVWKAVREGDLKYVQDSRPESDKAYVFDLASDVGESMDLAAKTPGKLDDLRQKYDQWESVVRANRRGRSED
ncbi:MAG: sulfatase-like hydrolase/transferase [Aureliella sp.]